MDTIFVKGSSRNSRILVGETMDKLAEYMPVNQVFIITDKNVYDIYKTSFPRFPVYTLTPGESTKTPASAIDICRWLMDNGAGRDAFILGIGGGMVCDMTGFVASVFMRGVAFGFVATSLLAQVDASLGGKNGVNLDGYKNIIGTFNQPQFVLCDTTMLHSLPTDELKNGLAEAVKHTLIADKKMFQHILNHAEDILKLDETLINKLVRHSIEVKSAIVSRDETEAGERRKLNLGHTWGHAVEKTDGIAHGQAVSIGLAFAAKLSEEKQLLSPDDRIIINELLHSLNLPTETNTDPKKIFRALVKDKKKEGDYIHFVLMNGIGNVTVEPLSLSELDDFIQTI